MKFKFYNYKRLYIYFCFLALLNIFFSTDNLYAKTFSINDIEISTPFEINFDKNKIIDEGFIQGFDQLLLSIIQTKDQKKLGKIPLSLIKSMIETFSIKEEKFINEIYYLNLNVSFNKKKIFDLLEKKNIFPSLPSNKDIFLIPIILEENKKEILMFSENKIYTNWNIKKKKYHLLEYILPSEDLEDFNFIKNNIKDLENYNFEEMIKKYNLNDYIIMIIFKNNQEIKVLSKINFNGVLDLKNLSFKNLNLDTDKDLLEFIEYLKEIYENYWKSQNEINTSVKLSLTISLRNNDNSKITKFESELSEIDLIYDFYIYKFNNRLNFYKIIFNGSPDNFLKIMSEKEYEIDTQELIWEIK